ncbi:hypothetical protein KGV55_03720 [Candidatus Gracilibacteria bacterium]|nr:hypothetical protein [Candidatus Gracilibacteria bacterium]
MQILALQGILESLQKDFRCPDCTATPKPKNISVESIKGEKMRVDITCHKCKVHSVLYAEVNKPIQDVIDSKTAKDLVDAMVENPKKTLGDQDIKEIEDVFKSGKNLSDIF